MRKVNSILNMIINITLLMKQISPENNLPHKVESMVYSSRSIQGAMEQQT